MLAKGQRLTEILKQSQYSPLPEEKQVAIIYAATNGYLDGYAVSECRRYEEDLYRYLDASHAGLLRDLAHKKDLKGELGERLKAALGQFAQVFQSKSAA
jgi:F-type H+-transporting ATPase subunit alpha